MLAPSLLNVCVKRSKEDASGSSTVYLDGELLGVPPSKRRLELISSLKVDENGNYKMTRSTRVTWAQLSSGASANVLSGLSASSSSVSDSVKESTKQLIGSETKAPVHDPCRDVTCPKNHYCYAGIISRHEPCYPSLYSKPGADSRTLFQQMAELSAYAYDARYNEEYAILREAASDGWQAGPRACLMHEGGVKSYKSISVDCALTFVKKSGGKNVCAISFTGTDDGTRELDAGGYPLDVVNFHGYAVLRWMVEEYARFWKIGELKRWLNMARDHNYCNQVYITGHSLGASIAILHRIDLGFGRVVGYGSPLIFAPYAAPTDLCFGDMYHVKTDPVKVFPAGFKLAGVTTNTLCMDEQIESDYEDLLAGKPRSKPVKASIQQAGCNAPLPSWLSPCDTIRPHLMRVYHALIEGVPIQTGDTNEDMKGVFKPCQRTSPTQWINQCVARSCEVRKDTKDRFGLDTRFTGKLNEYCSLGREELRGRLAADLQGKMVAEKLAAGSFANKMFNGFFDTAVQMFDTATDLASSGDKRSQFFTDAKESFGSMFEQAKASGSDTSSQADDQVNARKAELEKANEAFPVPDLKQAGLLKNNPNACGAGSVGCFPISIPNPLISDTYFMNIRKKGDSVDADKIKIELRIAKSGSNGPVTVGKAMTLDVTAKADGQGLNVMPMEMLESAPGGDAAASALKSEEAQKALTSFGQQMQQSEATPKFSLKTERTDQAAIICKTMPLPPTIGKQEMCLALVGNKRLDFLLRNPDSDVTYEMRGLLSVNGTSLSFDSAGSSAAGQGTEELKEVVQSAGELKDRYPDSFRADELPGAGMVKMDKYCARIILGATCKYGDDSKPCDAFRNADCMYGGLCGCPKGTCASSQGICVDESLPGAKQSLAGTNPCLGNDEDDDQVYTERRRLLSGSNPFDSTGLRLLQDDAADPKAKANAEQSTLDKLKGQASDISKDQLKKLTMANFKRMF
jgi:hypothetical protein